MRDLRGALLRWLVFARAGRYAPSHEFVPHGFTLSFFQLKDRAMDSAITVNILQGQRVVLFVSKETNDSAASVRSGCLAYLHWQSADLYPFITQKNIPHRSDVYLCEGLAALLKSQHIVLGRQGFFTIALCVRPTHEMSSANAE